MQSKKASTLAEALFLSPCGVSTSEYKEYAKTWNEYYFRPLKRGVTNKFFHDGEQSSLFWTASLISVSLKSVMNISKLFSVINHGRRRRIDSRIKFGSKTTTALPRERIFRISEFT